VNVCGTGEFSDELSVDIKSGEPAQMSPIEALIDNCSVKLTWTAPSSQGSPITGYIF
jgi:hypothetical protein